jgi:hypothetical protein
MLQILALFGASTALCPIQQAEYQSRDDPSVTATFYQVPRRPDWPSGLALRVRVAKTGRSYWFLPWQGGTDGRTHLAWVRERNAPIEIQRDRQDMEFFTTNESYDFNAEVPRQGGIAPTHMFIPDLTNLAWHSSTGQRRDQIPRSFFDATGCRKSTARSILRRSHFRQCPDRNRIYFPANIPARSALRAFSNSPHDRTCSTLRSSASAPRL